MTTRPSRDAGLFPASVLRPRVDVGETPLTPVEFDADTGVYIKRDDRCEYAGVVGGKVRTCRFLARGAPGLVTGGSRSSPQVNIVAHIARKMGVPCRVHVPQGDLMPEVAAAVECGAVVIQHFPGFNTVLSTRAADDARRLGWREIPFGMECWAAVEMTAAQVANLPFGKIKRLVVPVGSGMSLAGILTGMDRAGQSVPVLAIAVGAEPTRRLDRFAPADWPDRIRVIQSSRHDYHKPAPATFAGIKLDPFYEAKCVPYLRAGDCFWVVGIRQTELDV